MLFTSTFTGSEDPLSEGGRWHHQTALWYKLKKVAGLLEQVQANDGFNDNYAYLDGFDPNGDITVIGELFINTGLLDTVSSGNSWELELNLHLGDVPAPPDDMATGYQFDCSLDGPLGGPYNATLVPVRWNGLQGDFHVYSASGSVLGVVTGDRMKVVLAAGSNTVEVFWKRTTDPDYVSQYTQDLSEAGSLARLHGQPGVALFNRTAAQIGAASWQFYSADDGIAAAVTSLPWIE